MNEQMYTTDTAAERLTRSVAGAVESGGRFTRAEFSVDDVATILEDLAASSGEGVAAAKYWRQLQAMTVDRDRWVMLWETASNSVIRLRADIESAVQQPNREAEAVARLFHEAYERLAPQFDYSTRVASAVPWDDVPADNKALMIATADAVLAALAVPATPRNLVTPCHGRPFTILTRTEGSGHLTTDVPDEILCPADHCFNSWDANGVADEYNKEVTP